MARNLLPNEDGTQSLGSQLFQWLKGWFVDLCVSGVITDGVRSVTVEEIDNAVNNQKVSYSWNGTRDNAGTSDRDMKVGETLTNDSALIIPFTSNLKFISASTDGVESWEAHVYKNGTSSDSLVISGANSGTSALIDTVYNAGDEVRLRQVNGTGSISKPRIMVFFQAV